MFLKKIFKIIIINILIIFCASFVFEVILRIDGRYSKNVNRILVASKAIFEPVANSKIKISHPDGAPNVPNNYDESGVNNFNFQEDTKNKKKIIGLFGDSFTENIAVYNQFKIETVLNNKLFNNNFNYVNYGVNGYGLDQIFIRYLKYKTHDIKKVIYIFCENDIRNLYENQLFFYKDDQLLYKEPKINKIANILNKFYLSFFLLETYYVFDYLLFTKFKSFSLNNISNTSSWFLKEADTQFANKFNEHLINQRARHEDYYASKMTAEILSNQPSNDTVYYIKLFNDLLRNFKKEVNNDGRQFYIVVSSRSIDTLVFNNVIEDKKNYNILYLEESFSKEKNNSKEKFYFKKDGHWSEIGSLYVAKDIWEHLNSKSLNFEQQELLNKLEESVTSLYFKN
jgi:hypothetical protein